VSRGEGNAKEIFGKKRQGKGNEMKAIYMCKLSMAQIVVEREDADPARSLSAEQYREMLVFYVVMFYVNV
jgi:hypothetical protein